MRPIVAMMAFLTFGAVTRAEETNILELSLAECIELALEHNLDIQIDRIRPEIARYQLELAYAAYDPLFDFSAIHSHDESPGGLDDQNRPFVGSKTDQDSFRSGLRGILPTGLSYSLNGDLSRRTGSDPFGNLPPIAGGEAGITALGLTAATPAPTGQPRASSGCPSSSVAMPSRAKAVAGRSVRRGGRCVATAREAPPGTTTAQASPR
jgi:hypothetical protein